MLKVWLPLNGTLENKGISNYTFGSTGITVDNAGKIGKCYSFNNGRINNTNVSLGTGAISAACWVYFSTDTSTLQYMISLNATTGFADHALGIACNTDSKIYFVIGGDQNVKVNAPALNTWVHMAITYDGNTVKAYFNGEEQASRSGITQLSNKTCLTFGARYNNNNAYTGYLKGKLNDVRIYDHCLSAAEVREISQALILHYKLDSSYIETKIQDNSGYEYNAIVTGTPLYNSDTPRYLLSTKVNNSYATISNNIFTSEVLNPELTFSCWVKRENTENTTMYIYNGIVLIGMTTSYPLIISWTNSNTAANNSWAPGSAYAPELGVWTHIAFTFDNGIWKYYKNGELTRTADRGTQNILGIKSNKIFCGTTSQKFIGSLSDMRVYTTCLDDNAIRQLYEVGAKVDNKQNLHTFELVENSSKIQITHNGQVKCNELEEDEKVKFYKTNKIIETNEIIEL